MEDKLLFTDDNFELVPAEGEIWPGATVAVTVIFRPTEPKQYRQVGREMWYGFVPCWHCTHSMRSRVYEMVRCSSVCPSMGLQQQTHCCGPDMQEILIDCCSNGMWRANVNSAALSVYVGI